MTRVSFGFRRRAAGGFSPPGIECERYDLHSNITQLPLGFMVEFDRAGVLVGLTPGGDPEPAPPSRCFSDTSVLLDTCVGRPDNTVGAGADVD